MMTRTARIGRRAIVISVGRVDPATATIRRNIGRPHIGGGIVTTARATVRTAYVGPICAGLITNQETNR